MARHVVRMVTGRWRP